MNEVLSAALDIFQEAVGYVQEQKASRAVEVLFAHDGSYAEALCSEKLSPTTRAWLSDLRDTLCRHLR